jgi:hypothetical protein
MISLVNMSTLDTLLCLRSNKRYSLGPAACRPSQVSLFTPDTTIIALSFLSYS